MRNLKKAGKNIFLWLGILLLLGAVCLTGYNVWDANRADTAAQNVVSRLEEMIADAATHESTQGTPVVPDPYKEFEPLPDELPTIAIDSDLYIGILIIPELQLELPVMNDWSYDKLRIAPCRYTGSYYSDHFVIAGHNYNRHLGAIRHIRIGADVYFQTAEGKSIHYQVDNIETLRPTQIEDMITGDWDLTLFTCTLGGQTRHTVRCTKVE